MPRVRSFLAIVSLSLGFLAAVVGIALGAESILEELGALPLQASDPPGLLAPITEAGRNGWNRARARCGRPDRQGGTTGEHPKCVPCLRLR